MACRISTASQPARLPRPALCDFRRSNPRADSLLKAGRGETDTVRRRAIYRAFQALEQEDPPVMVLYYPREIQAMSAHLSGVPPLGIRDTLRHIETFTLR